MSDSAGNDLERAGADASTRLATDASDGDEGLGETMHEHRVQRTVAVHQPNYLPWIGYFHKIAASDVFVFLDDVEYTSNSWINRNKIKTPDGWTWLTVPVRDSSGPIDEVRIADDDWRTIHRKSLQQNYGKATCFDEVIDLFEATYDRSWDSLCELNVHLVRSIADMGHEIGVHYDLGNAPARQARAGSRTPTARESTERDADWNGSSSGPSDRSRSTSPTTGSWRDHRRLRAWSTPTATR